MEIVIKVLSTIGIGIVIVASICGIIEIALRIYNYILDKKIAKLKRKSALYALGNLKLSYKNLMLCRKRYHEAKYIENSEERIKKQEELKAIYQYELDTLSNPDCIPDKEYLTNEERAELEEVLSRPRYGLF